MYPYLTIKYDVGARYVVYCHYFERRKNES